MREAIIFVCDVCSYSNEDKENVSWHETNCIDNRKRKIQLRKSRESIGQLTISQIIQKCKTMPNLPIIIKSYDSENVNNEYVNMYPCNTYSYRGRYDELALNVSNNLTNTNSFFETMQKSLNKTYIGWKGGEFNMENDTFVWVSNYGLSSELMVVDLLLAENGKNVELVIKKNNL